MSKQNRKLAAIMFTDIVGYTALMQKDEQTASVLLRRFQKNIEVLVPKNNGQIINFYGDGALCIFNNPLEAARSAMQLQNVFSENPRVPVRLGLHSGTVVFENEKIYGDSVNIASRIESMGVPGAVLFSKKIRDEIKNQPELKIKSLGNFAFKNVEEEMEVFALANEGFIVPKRENMKGKLRYPLWSPMPKGFWIPVVLFTILSLGIAFLAPFLSNQKTNTTNDSIGLSSEWENSIAILPFDNLNNDPEKEYLSVGIADEVRSQLTLIQKLKVIARSSSMFYQNKDLPIAQIGKELQADYILDGSVQQLGNELKINVHLSNANTNQMVWSPEAILGKMDAIFSLQKDIAETVVHKLKIELSDKEKIAMAKRFTDNPKVYNLYLEAHGLFNRYNERAEMLYKEALAIEPEFALAYTGLAEKAIVKGMVWGTLSTDSARIIADSLLTIAANIDNDFADLHLNQGKLDYYLKWDAAKGEAAFRKATEKGIGWDFLADLLIKNGRFSEALIALEKAKELNPLSYWIPNQIGRAYFFQKKYDKALEIVLDVKERFQDWPDIHRTLGMFYLNSGKYKKAIEVLQEGIDVRNIDYPFLLGNMAIAYHRLGKTEKADAIIKTLEQKWKNKSGGDPAFFLAQIYAGLKEEEKVFLWLEKSYQAHESDMIWLKTEPQFEYLKNDPRYQAMLEKVGFP